MVDEYPIDGNNELIKADILRKLCYSVAEKIKTSEAYCKFLMNSIPLHVKVIETLNYAIKLHEEEEKYELCGVLFNFQQKLINKEGNYE